MPTLHPALPIGTHNPWLSPEDALATKIRMILDTRPGQVPWNPSFGCNLEELVGRPANDAAIALARHRIEEALSNWLPDVTVLDCQVRLLPRPNTAGMFKQDGVPLAESMLVSMGTQVILHVDVELETDVGVMSIAATVEP